MKIKVSITQKHIDNGLPKSARRCPVALAFMDLLLPHFREIASVGLDGVFFEREMFPKFEFPKRVGELIYKYDLAGKMKPFKFDIDIPESVRYFFRSNIDG
jgi:hypothetical protein